MADRVCLVIPCYNEARRLRSKEFIESANADLHLCFVNDGSTDNTMEVLLAIQQENKHVSVLQCPQNVGKAEAVRFAILQMLEKQNALHFDWIGFWDSDLSTPLEEVSNMLQYKNVFYPDADAVWGSRVYRLGSKIIRSSMRHYLGRFFATVIYYFFGVESYDSQCGAKLFRSGVANTVFQEPFISKWIFDVEVLLRMKNNVVVEYPLKFWQDIPGSKLKVGKESFRVFADILKIKKRYRG